ncbi:A/G-specific adenine glycosylase [PVC group bacterium (ex Bugula neritina AB1)]|nr:A/G-specific adenine glycosylase [PVC group bacterium (ex Bugula neritina AB1)]
MRDEVVSSLLKWYQENARTLPWRDSPSPYRVWISEIMLQQTTVATVIPYFSRWMIDFPDIKSVAEASLDEILKQWQGLGYYRRAQNIHKAANIMVEYFDGEVPEDKETLKTLPGFGPYTTAAVLSIAFGQREAIVDTNVRRFIMRLLGREGIADSKQDKWIREYLEFLMPYKEMRSFNQSLMEIGALICPSKTPKCLICPVQKNCKAFHLGLQDVIPITKKKKLEKIDAGLAVIHDKKKFYIQKRPAKGLWANMWEFPGGKREERETLEETVRREIKEEVGIELSHVVFFSKIRHFYTHFDVSLHVFICETNDFIEESEVAAWVSLEEMKKYPMPSANGKILDQLREHFV